jgi:hypothetical protein
MKKHFRIFAAFLTFALLISIHTVSMAQPAPPPPNPPGGGHGLPGDQPAGGAPIGNGTYILLTLAAAYALRKVYVMRAATPVTEE